MSKADAPPQSSRRGGDRTHLGTELVFQPTGQAPRVGTIVDLSPGGARIETAKAGTAGEALVVYLPYPSREEPTPVTAVVRWSDAKGMGVQFNLGDGLALEALLRLSRNPSLAKPAKKPDDHTIATDDTFSRDVLLAVPKPIHSMKRRVRFQEVDAAGTIYYSRIFEYFGDVYVELLERDGLSVPKVMSQKEWFAPLVHAEADYLGPMRFGDTVEVAIAKVEAGKSSATIGYRISSSKDGRALAVGHTVHVFVDGATFRPCPIPADVRHALTRGP
jgi:YbgC/YbaW family acyl-CoA thioester hydrolase